MLAFTDVFVISFEFVQRARDQLPLEDVNRSIEIFSKLVIGFAREGRKRQLFKAISD